MKNSLLSRHLPVLKDMANILAVPAGGTKEAVVEAIVQFCKQPSATDSKVPRLRESIGSAKKKVEATTKRARAASKGKKAKKVGAVTSRGLVR